MKLFIKSKREGYSPEQCRKSMTIGEMIAYLSQFDDDTSVYISNDNGYTYGSITETSFEEEYDDDEGEQNYEKSHF